MNSNNPSPEAQDCRPSWITIEDMKFYFGIGKTRAYELMNEGNFETRNLTKAGKKRGKRLINYDSVDTFITELSN